MAKKILAIIIALLIAGVLLCGWGAKTDKGWFTNPDISTWFPDLRDDIEEKHEHKYDKTKWVIDSNNHWHASTCGHNIKGDLAAHTYKNGVCTVCDYKQPTATHVHTFDTENWKVDGTHHWHASTCEHFLAQDKAEHTIKDGACTVCGYNSSEPEHEHTYDMENWKIDGTYHWHASTCEHNKAKDMEKHTYKDYICTVCGYKTEHIHTFDMEHWSSGSAAHFHASTCGHDVISDPEPHTYKNEVCTVCGYKQTDEEHVHTFDTENWESDLNNHWHVSTCEHYIVKDMAAHTFKGGDCTVCGYLDPNHAHMFDPLVWEYDSKNHWHPSKCGHDIISSEAEHTYQNGKCTVCGCRLMNEMHKHNYVDGVCTDCGKSE